MYGLLPPKDRSSLSSNFINTRINPRYQIEGMRKQAYWDIDNSLNPTQSIKTRRTILTVVNFKAIKQ